LAGLECFGSIKVNPALQNLPASLTREFDLLMQENKVISLQS